MYKSFVLFSFYYCHVYAFFCFLSGYLGAGSGGIPTSLFEIVAEIGSTTIGLQQGV